jgi:hypothetical protein
MMTVGLGSNIMRSKITFVLASASLITLCTCPAQVWAQINSGDAAAAAAKDQKVEPASADTKIILNKLQSLSSDQRIILERLDQVIDTLKTAKSATAISSPEPGKAPVETKALKPDMSGQEQMADISKKMDEILKLNQQVQANTRDVGVLQRKHDNMQIEMSQVQSDIIKLQQDIGRLRNQMEGLRSPSDIGREDLQRRSSASLPLPLPPDSTATPTAPTRPMLGTVRLMNSYVFPVSVVVDGKLYTLGTNEAKDLERLPGAFTYEVVGIQGNTLRTLNAGETLTIRVYPR